MPESKMRRSIAKKCLGPFGILLALVCVAPLNMGGCAAGNLPISDMVQAGVKGGRALTLSEKDENDLGQSVAIAVTSQYGVYDDDRLNRYVTLVGMTVASASPRSDLRFYFCVLNSEEVNAFSGPDGYVMITHGAISHMRDESELAAVLAHEIGHVVKKHGLDAVRQAGLMDAGLTLAKTNDAVAQMGRMSDSVVDLVTKKGFSQPQENEADAEGVKYLIAAGYDPNGFLRFLNRLQAERSHGGKNLFATHPGLDERISRVGDLVTKSGKGGTGASLAERFVANTGVR